MAAWVLWGREPKGAFVKCCRSRSSWQNCQIVPCSPEKFESRVRERENRGTWKGLMTNMKRLCGLQAQKSVDLQRSICKDTCWWPGSLPVEVMTWWKPKPEFSCLPGGGQEGKVQNWLGFNLHCWRIPGLFCHQGKFKLNREIKLNYRK